MQHKRDIIIRNIKKYLTAGAVTAAMSLLTACGSGTAPAAEQTISADETAAAPAFNELEASDTALFLEYDPVNNGVQLMSVDNGRSYTVSVNNLTEFKDNHGKVSVPELFEAGMIVNADVSIHSKTLKLLEQSPDAFVKQDVTGFEISPNRGVFRLADGTNLHVTENTLVLKGDKKAKLSDISDSDVLLIRGIEPELYSIKIMSGYGHLKIKGSEYFTGGWVEIAGLFKPVTEDMLLDVPEGEYDLVVTYKGQGGTKHVTINRGRQTVADISDLKGDLIKTGDIIFTIRPLDAVPTVKIDGKAVDHQNPVTLEYGVYQLEIQAEGYTPVKERISVGAELSNIEIELIKAEEKTSVSKNSSSSSSSEKKAPPSVNNLPTTFTGSSSSSSDSSVSGNSSSMESSSSSSYESSIIQGSRIYIDAPEMAEVYFDGIYKGMVPCSFIKESGTHVITLRRDGYETRTFTVTIDNDSENETFSFSDLQEDYTSSR